MEQIGELIIELRKEKGMTQKQLAEHLHISDHTISKWERNIGYPDISLLQPLAEVLGIDVDVLLSGKRENKQQEPKTSSYLLNYVSERMRKNTHILMGVLSLIGMLAILICFICDYANANTFSWSLIVAISILYAIAILACFLFTKKEKIMKGTMAVTVGIFPFLWCIAFVLQQDWFLYPALPIVFLCICYTWAMVLLFRFWEGNILYKIAILIAIAPVLSIMINGILGAINVFHWLSLFVNECIALLFFLLGYFNKK